jgi:dTMP kinase
MMRGKFIVVEGADCTGKTTQTNLLINFLKQSGYDVKALDFPTYEKTPGGTVVKWYLEGKFGKLAEVPPEVACLTYALDRYQFAKENYYAIAQGNFLVANRYTQSNIGHQGGKFKGAERTKFIDWIEKVESRMPQPDFVVYLDLPVEISLKLKQKRGENKGAREKDIHEADIQHLKDARESYLETAKRKNWIMIDCKRKDAPDIRSIEDIHKEILAKLKEKGALD